VSRYEHDYTGSMDHVDVTEFGNIPDGRSTGSSGVDLDITYKRTRCYRPQTNGKIERFHRTLADGRA